MLTFIKPIPALLPLAEASQCPVPWTQVEHEVGDGETDPYNISTTNNINMYVNNTQDDYNTEMDGFTITLTLTMFVNPNETNSIRIALADVGDSQYDSNVLIAGNSIQTKLIAMSDDVNVYPDGTTTLNVLGNDINNGPGVLTITHINNQPVTTGTTITLPTGQQITLNADGTFNVVGDGDEEDFNFTYTISNGTDTDVGWDHGALPLRAISRPSTSVRAHWGNIAIFWCHRCTAC